MELLQKLFESLPDLSGPLQMGIDVLILALLFAILAGGRKKGAPDAEQLVKRLGAVIEETVDLSKEFNSNLEDRKLLIQQITASLDQKIAEARQIAAKFEATVAAAAPSDPEPAEFAPVKGADRKKVLLLARQGLDADQIARQLRKPVGEVELVLNLQRISA